ncbi:MAG: hypothetical protein ORN83_14340, partial [Chthoniobacteraceae bacterium]|nr:hypothetical protein [Chthoniobacteraceae bacterium]
MPLSFSVVSGPATVSNGTLSIIGTGTVTVRATQPGSSNFLPAASVEQSFVVSRASQTVNFGTLDGKTFLDAPFSLTASASSTLPVTFTVLDGPGTLNAGTLTLLAAGTVTLQADQSGNENYNPAAPVVQSLQVAKAPQSIDFAPLGSKTYLDAPFTLSATSSSSLPVDFEVLSGPATISNGSLSLIGAGTVTVRASQPGDSNFLPASVDRSFVVNLANQTLTFGTLSAKTFLDAPFSLTASASSSLPVDFLVLSGPAAVSNGTLSIIGAGTVTVRVSQSGGSNFLPAASLDQSFSVGRANQALTFGTLSAKTFLDAPFSLTASASSSLPVDFQVLSGPAAISNGTLSIIGTGTVTVRAAQSGDSNFLSAPSVERSFVVSRASQAVNFGTLSAKTFLDAPFSLTASASSDLPVTFTVLQGPGTLNSGTLTLLAAGTVTLQANQAGNENYNPAAPVVQSLQVLKAPQSIDFAPLDSKTYLDAPFTLSATSSSSLPVAFQVLSGSATISNGTLSIVGAGTVTVRATQLGNSNFLPATPVEQSFSVNRASQTLTFGTLAARTFLDAPFSLTATAGSSLPVDFQVLSGSATISNGTLSIVGAGTVTVRASQSGGSNFLPAAPVEQSFSVSRANQTLAFGTLSAKTFGDAPFSLTASATSGLPVTFTVLDGPGTLNSGTLTIFGAGSVTVRASQEGNLNYAPASSVNRSFMVFKAPATVVIGGTLDVAYDGVGHGATVSTIPPSLGVDVTYAIAGG